MDLDECYKKGLIKKTKISANLIKSLIYMAHVNELTVKEAKLNEVNISPHIILAYESLREILEAICILNGFKVLSHICLGELLKTLIKDFYFDEFDRIRYIRNGINYYGARIELSQGKEIIRKALYMKNSLLEKYLKDFK